jgi:hypothetical protein
MNVTPAQRAQLEDYLKQVAAWKSVLGENAERCVVGDRIMGVPCSALAIEAVNDFIHPGWPVGDADYADPNDVMVMRAFGRALANPKVNESVASILRLIRVEPNWVADEWGKRLARILRIYLAMSFIEQTKMRGVMARQHGTASGFLYAWSFHTCTSATANYPRSARHWIILMRTAPTKRRLYLAAFRRRRNISA